MDIVLERPRSSINWGFRLHSVAKSGVAVQLVYDGSIADECGLDIADKIIQIGDTDITGLSVFEAKKLVSQQGDQLRLKVLRRGAFSAIHRVPPNPVKKAENKPNEGSEKQNSDSPPLQSHEVTTSQAPGRASWYDPDASKPSEKWTSESPPVQSHEVTTSHAPSRASWYDPEASKPSEKWASESPPVQRREALKWRHEMAVSQAMAPQQRSSLPAEAVTTEETVAWPRPTSQAHIFQQLEAGKEPSGPQGNRSSSSEDSVVLRSTLPRGVNSALAPRGEGRNAKRVSGGVSVDSYVAPGTPPKSPLVGSFDSLSRASRLSGGVSVDSYVAPGTPPKSPLVGSFDSLSRTSRLSRSSAVEEEDRAVVVLPPYQRNMAGRGFSGSLPRTLNPSLIAKPKHLSDGPNSTGTSPRNSSIQMRSARGSTIENEDDTAFSSLPPYQRNIAAIANSRSLPRNVNSALAPRGEGRAAKRLSGSNFVTEDSLTSDVTQGAVMRNSTQQEAESNASRTSGSPHEDLAALPAYQRELAARLDALSIAQGPPAPQVNTAINEDWSQNSRTASVPSYQRDWRALGKASPRANSPEPSHTLPPGQIVHSHGPAEVVQCDLCARAIVGPFVRLLNKFRVHPECVRCHECGKCLRNDTRVMVEKYLYCEVHALEVAQPPEPGLVPKIVFPGAENHKN